MEKCLFNEINKKFIEAVECYENEIKKNGPDIFPDTFINLAFLYWSFAFELFEFVTINDISDYWSKKGGERFLKVLDLGIEKFPNNTEIHFWKKYFLHISYGEEFTESECLNLIEQYGDMGSKIPYFFLYLFQNDRYEDERLELIRIAEEIPSVKNLYVKSILV